MTIYDIFKNSTALHSQTPISLKSKVKDKQIILDHCLLNKILFLSASPVEQDRLEVIKEFKKIEFEVQRAKYGKEIKIEQAHEVSLNELQNLLLKYRPRIVHFSGHGSTKGKLVFQNYSTNKPEMVSIEAVGNLFTIVNQNECIRCVILSACYS